MPKVKCYKQGFTMVELILVIVMFAIIFSSTVIVFGNMLGQYSLAAKGHEIVQNLREARINSIAQKEDSGWGVYLDTVADPDSYTLFMGNSYASRNSAYDFVMVLPKAVSFSNINLIGGSEVVFSKRSGETSNIGDFNLITSDDQFNVSINRLGIVDYDL